jgi:hypothetical protein
VTRIAKNTLAGWSVAFLAAYWIVGLTSPPVWFQGGIAAGQFIIASMVLYRWGPSALHFVTEREQQEVEGDLLSLVGIATLALGAVWSGVFVGAWLAFGSPDHWLATPYSAFGRGLSIAGFFLLHRGASVQREVLRPVNWAILLPIVAALGIGLFFAGAKWQKSKGPDLHLSLSEFRPRCPPDRAVLGNVNSRGVRLYHTQASPYRFQVQPEQCFASEGEARANGYRKAG